MIQAILSSKAKEKKKFNRLLNQVTLRKEETDWQSISREFEAPKNAKPKDA
jgi:hypothetical protein